MEVVGHQAVSVDEPARLGAGLSQCLQELVPVLIVLEDVLPAVAA